VCAARSREVLQALQLLLLLQVLWCADGQQQRTQRQRTTAAG
jgi:hypothetical protein